MTAPAVAGAVTSATQAPGMASDVLLHLRADRVPDDRRFPPKWGHERPAPGRYGTFVVDRLSDAEMAGLRHGEFFDETVDYRQAFPEMPHITRVWQLDPSGQTLWMTDGPQEVAMMGGLCHNQTGNILVTGLGMGIVQQKLLSRHDVHAVTTIEAHPDVHLLHERLSWWRDPRHTLIIGKAQVVLPSMVASGRFDGYVLDHWDTLGDHLEEKVAFLRLLDGSGQSHRPVSLWGFWWEIERALSSNGPDTRRLLDQVTRRSDAEV